MKRLLILPILAAVNVYSMQGKNTISPEEKQQLLKKYDKICALYDEQHVEFQKQHTKDQEQHIKDQEEIDRLRAEIDKRK